MSFGKYGIPQRVPNGDSFQSSFDAFYEEWKCSLNYDFYSTEGFYIEKYLRMFEYLDFIRWELKSLRGIIGWFENSLSMLGVDQNRVKWNEKYISKRINANYFEWQFKSDPGLIEIFKVYKDLLRTEGFLHERYHIYSTEISFIYSTESNFPKQESKKVKTTQIGSFKWNGNLAKNEGRIECLYKSLKSKKLIDCKYVEFRNLFKGGAVAKQIEWLGYPIEIIYLFYLLWHEDNKLIIEPKAKWKTMVTCFNYGVVKNSQILSEISSSKTLPKNAGFFDAIIKDIKSIEINDIKSNKEL